MKRRFSAEELRAPQPAVQGATWSSWAARHFQHRRIREGAHPLPPPLSPSTGDQGFPHSPGRGATERLVSRPAGQRLTRALTLVLPQSYGSRVSDPFFEPFVAGIMDHASTRDFSLLLLRGGASADQTSPYLQQIRRGQVDGFFIVRTSPQDTRIRLLQAEGVPFVVYGRTLDGLDYPYVDIDNEGGIGKMVDHLIQLGHARIAGIVEPAGLTKSVQRRCGLRAALDARGVLNPELIVDGHYTRESGYSGTRRLLARADRPTAIVCADDLMAVGACAAASDAGLRVGRDVSIGGFDDAFGDDLRPGLTTICNPARKIGQMLCQMLIQIVSGHIPSVSRVVLDPDLVVRQSTGPAPS